jgi:hypothetical protein
MIKDVVKKLILAIVLIVGATNIFAQKTEKTELLSNEEFFQRADFIVEGKIIGINGYTYDIGGKEEPNDLYISGLVLVSYVYKNNTNESISVGDTLNYVRKGGTLFKKINDCPDIPGCTAYYIEEIRSNEELINIADKEPAIWFFIKDALPMDPNGDKNSKYFRVNPLQTKKNAIINLSYGIKGLNGLSFPNRDSLDSYMLQFENYGVSNLYQQKRKEIEELKSFYYQLDMFDIDNIYQIDSLFDVLMDKIAVLKKREERVSYGKIQEQQTELDDFIHLIFQEFSSDGNKRKQYINRINEKKNVEAKSGSTKAWVFFSNFDTYYDNTVNKNYLEFKNLVKNI